MTRSQSATVPGLAVSPALGTLAESNQLPPQYALIDCRVLQLSGVAIVLGVAAAVVAQLLLALIALITNFAFSGRLSLQPAVAADAVPQLG